MLKNKILKILIIALLGSIALVSCSEENTTETETKTSGEKVNIVETKIEKTDEEIKNEIIDGASKRVKEAKEFNKLLFSNGLKNCEKEEDVKMCKKIFVQKEGFEQKNSKVCEFLKDKKEIGKCKNKVISKLVTIEMNPKYCEELEDDMEKEMCRDEYERNLEVEVGNVRSM